MNRLKQAIELSRQEREASRPTSSDREVQSRVPDPNTSISYTQTRVIRPQAKVLARNRVITSSTDDAVVAAYKLLRTQVLQRMKANDWSTLAITSPKLGEGKTLTAINLSISLALQVTHTVILVDLDLRRPRVHQYFGYKPAFGIGDHLIGNVPLSKILFNPHVDGLVVLPGRKPLANSSELLSSPKMNELVEELKSRYPSRIVLFDLPPLLSADDALAFSPYADTVILIIEDGKTSREEMTRSLELLGGTNVLGTVLNKSKGNLNSYY